ncbi:MAG: hypothetical protein U0414_40555 [Polyangiaceae bacterium]
MPAICENCGAPDTGADIICKFCRNPINKALLDGAIPCPNCRTPNRAERTQCSACNCGLLQMCIFCNHASPVNARECQRCGEAFAGAKERKDQAAADQILGGITNFVGNIAGALTGSGGHSHHHHRHDNDYDDRDRGRRGGGNYGGSDDGAPPMES